MASTRAATRIRAFDPAGTVFAEFTALSARHNALNLGQGFPAFPAPVFVDNALREVVDDAANAAHRAKPTTTKLNLLHQYTRSEGHPRLVNALARYYAARMGPTATLDPLTNIITTVGASEAIASTILAFVNPGDKVVLIQPFYDSYPAAVTLAGGEPIMVTLERPQNRHNVDDPSSDDFKLDFEELDEACSRSNVQMLILNNPHNPLGKVFTREELLKISEIAAKHDILVLADEVYETLVYDDAISPMIKFASLPGMWERTITVGSIGKMLGVTGWKLGWAMGPKDLIRDIWLVHQFIPFVANTPLQDAAGRALEHVLNEIDNKGEENGFFRTTCKQYTSLRNLMQTTLSSVGLHPIKPHGGYFTIADTSHLVESKGPSYDHKYRDYRICKTLTVDAGVTAIPLSPFYYSNEDKVKHAADYIRFAFCKNENDIKAAGTLLAKYSAKH